MGFPGPAKEAGGVALCVALERDRFTLSDAGFPHSSAASRLTGQQQLSHVLQQPRICREAGLQ